MRAVRQPQAMPRRSGRRRSRHGTPECQGVTRHCPAGRSCCSPSRQPFRSRAARTAKSWPALMALMLERGWPAPSSTVRGVPMNVSPFPVTLPSCPQLSSPQHLTVPSASRAQVNSAPAATATAPVSPGTGWGVAEESFEVPRPSCPSKLRAPARDRSVREERAHVPGASGRLDHVRDPGDCHRGRQSRLRDPCSQLAREVVAPAAERSRAPNRAAELRPHGDRNCIVHEQYRCRGRRVDEPTVSQLAAIVLAPAGTRRHSARPSHVENQSPSMRRPKPVAATAVVEASVAVIVGIAPGPPVAAAQTGTGSPSARTSNSVLRWRIGRSVHGSYSLSDWATGPNISAARRQPSSPSVYTSK
jgi:hypothetical protein